MDADNRPDASGTANPEKGATAAQLRERIDAGETGDRQAESHPAAAPLGADAEAGGRSTPREDIAKAREQEVRRGDDSDAS